MLFLDILHNADGSDSRIVSLTGQTWEHRALMAENNMRVMVKANESFVQRMDYTVNWLFNKLPKKYKEEFKKMRSEGEWSEKEKEGKRSCV